MSARSDTNETLSARCAFCGGFHRIQTNLLTRKSLADDAQAVNEVAGVSGRPPRHGRRQIMEDWIFLLLL